MPSSSEKFLNLLTLRYSVCSFNSVWLEKQPLWMHFPFFLFTFIPLSFASVLSNSMLKSRSFYHCMIKKRTASNKMELFLTLNKNSNVTTYPNTNQKKVANEKGRDCGWKSLCECLNSNKDSGVKRPVLFRSLFRSLSLRNHANCWHTQKKSVCFQQHYGRHYYGMQYFLWYSCEWKTKKKCEKVKMCHRHATHLPLFGIHYGIGNFHSAAGIQRAFHKYVIKFYARSTCKPMQPNNRLNKKYIVYIYIHNDNNVLRERQGPYRRFDMNEFAVGLVRKSAQAHPSCFVTVANA